MNSELGQHRKFQVSQGYTVRPCHYQKERDCGRSDGGDDRVKGEREEEKGGEEVFFLVKGCNKFNNLSQAMAIFYLIKGADFLLSASGFSNSSKERAVGNHR